MHSATGLRRSRSAIHVLICLLLILAGAVGASLIQTGGGHIAVQGLKIPGKDGAVASADLFRPDTATATRKAPLIIVTPGFQRTKETQISYPWNSLAVDTSPSSSIRTIKANRPLSLPTATTPASSQPSITCRVPTLSTMSIRPRSASPATPQVDPKCAT